MSKTPGTIQVSSGVLTATFPLGSIAYVFTATFSGPHLGATVTPSDFTTSSATVAYNDVSVLDGNKPFVGQVDSQITICFPARSLHLTGTLTTPISPPQEIAGVGVWSTKPIMPTALGTLVTTSSTKFVAEFTINDKKYTLDGSFSPPMSTFRSNLVTLTYTTLGELIGSPGFTGEVGVDGIYLQLSTPKVTIVGDLTASISSKITIAGTGSWSSK
ncbi:hypothetical protein BD779DRAFT_703332 [Infundibulicybe gibba]|nr:hypothetical protein BD779DRAFT_703332 [Infundibulicybe gibba]